VGVLGGSTPQATKLAAVDFSVPIDIVPTQSVDNLANVRGRAHASATLNAIQIAEVPLKQAAKD
jgi:hypothetical protein